MPTVGIAGGGLAGLAAAAALGSIGFEVTVYESRSFLGGRATSYPVPGGETVIDNCQHVLLRCCVNLLDFYQRLNVHRQIRFSSEFYFVEPGGRASVFTRGILPAPFHFAESFIRMSYLSLSEKASLAKALLAAGRDYKHRRALDSITMSAWLAEHLQPPRVIERFWRPVLVSAINEELDRMAASHGLQVIALGFLANRRSYEMGLPDVPLAQLYGESAWSSLPTVQIKCRQQVSELLPNFVVAAGQGFHQDHVVSALSADKVQGVLAGLNISAFEFSPITGIHLWFDRPVTELPHAVLLDRTIQWMFNKENGTHLQLVVSASRSLVPLSKNEIVDLAIRELAEYFPAVASAGLQKSHVVKELHATFSAKPNLESLRPPAGFIQNGVVLAGDWTQSGWPATMEGAVRSGYRAAEVVAAKAGRPTTFVLPDVA